MRPAVLVGSIMAAEVLDVLRGRGLPIASVEFVSDPWDHVVEWVGRNDRGIAVVRGTVVVRCRWTADQIDVVFSVSEPEPL